MIAVPINIPTYQIDAFCRPMADNEDEDYYLPLEDQRVFGAGIKRKRINFVPATTSDPPTANISTKTKPDIGSRYLSIVLPKSQPETQDATPLTREASSTPDPPPPGSAPSGICPICAQPLSTTHESSIAHQFCLEHSHPPSHLPRSHVGVRYLSNYGWDPDSRTGLGARAEGITAPIKAKQKRDTVGLRERVDEDEQAVSNKKKTAAAKRKAEEKVMKLNAKEVRLRDKDAKMRAERLRQSFYGPELDKYLGT